MPQHLWVPSHAHHRFAGQLDSLDPWNKRRHPPIDAERDTKSTAFVERAIGAGVLVGAEFGVLPDLVVVPAARWAVTEPDRISATPATTL